MHTQVLGIAGVGVVALALLPAGAQAQPTRAAGSGSADLQALNAYRSYLGAINNNAHIAETRDSQVVTGVLNTCPGALSDVNDLSADQLKKSALTDFADEIDADLSLAYLEPNRTALTGFASTLAGLHWSATTQTRTVTRFVRTQRTLLNDGEANLCDDATTLDAAPLSEPTSTSRFLKRYRTVDGAASGALKGFQSLLGQFETSSERRLVTQVNTLVAQYSTQSQSTEQADASSILSDLGISQS